MLPRDNWPWTLFALVAMGLFSPAHPAQAQSGKIELSGPHFGVIWNDDGDWSTTSEDPAEAARGIEFIVDYLAGTPVKTLAYSVGAGSEILVYPTKVASTWGWRETGYEEKKGWEAWSARIRKGKALAAVGFDAVRVAGERAKKLGLFFFPSLRMNDAHFVTDPMNYPLTGKFWMDHQEYAIKNSGLSPIESESTYANLLDFSHEAVRRYRLDTLFEIIDRYQDIMDGVELDFTRIWVLFPRGQGKAKGHLVTEMLSEVRQKLDDRGRANKRKYSLMVRVPSQLESCRWAGLEVERWLEKRLVDVLVPAQFLTTAFEMPVDEFVALAHKADCKVYANLYPRTGWEWPFVENPTQDTYASNATRSIPTDRVRAAAANYWHMGVDGICFFNMRYEEGGEGPFADSFYRKIRDVARPECLNGESKVFAITKAYYLDHEGNYTYRKQIPLTLESNKAHPLRIMFGEDLDPGNSRAKLRYCGLRLGFRGMASERNLEIRINNEALYSGQAGDRLVSVAGKEAFPRKYMPPAATTFWQLAVQDTSVLRQGWNEITIQVGPGEAEQELVLTDVNLGVLYDNNLRNMLLR